MLCRDGEKKRREVRRGLIFALSFNISKSPEPLRLCRLIMAWELDARFLHNQRKQYACLLGFFTSSASAACLSSNLIYLSVMRSDDDHQLTLLLSGLPWFTFNKVNTQNSLDLFQYLQQIAGVMFIIFWELFLFHISVINNSTRTWADSHL